jgi:NTP pyrophosphatase (non-canonical NTP hydrolase)
MNDLTIREIVEKAVSRANRWHNGNMNEWSALEWAGAMCGEAGEAANAAKKLKRLETGIKSINPEDRSFAKIEEAKQFIGQEVGDTILYAVLLAAHVGFDGPGLEAILRDVFNKKSEQYGFTERL